MADHLLAGERLTANVAGYLVLFVDVHHDLGGLPHHPVAALPALVVAALAAELAEQLPALGVRALQRHVHDLAAAAAQEVLVQFVDAGAAQAHDVKPLHQLDLLLVGVHGALRGEHQVLLDRLSYALVGLHDRLGGVDVLDARGVRVDYAVAEPAAREFAARVMNLLNQGIGGIHLVLILLFALPSGLPVRDALEFGVHFGPVRLALGVQPETHLTGHLAARFVQSIGSPANLGFQTFDFLVGRQVPLGEGLLPRGGLLEVHIIDEAGDVGHDFVLVLRRSPFAAGRRHC